jgi:hypothetical protein
MGSPGSPDSLKRMRSGWDWQPPGKMKDTKDEAEDDEEGEEEKGRRRHPGPHLRLVGTNIIRCRCNALESRRTRTV